MEAVASFSLACNVIQVVAWGIDFTRKYRAICDKGSTDDIIDTTAAATHIKHLDSALKRDLSAVAISATIGNDDRRLQELGTKCSEAANELLKILTGLAISPASSHSGITGKLRALRAGGKMVWKKDDVKKLETKLALYQKTLDTSLLMNLRQRVGSMAANQKLDFAIMDDKIQRLVNGLIASDLANVTRLNQVILDESLRTRQYITQEITQVSQQVSKLQVAVNERNDLELQKVLQDEYLKSLHFPQIYSRQEQISEVHAMTYQWIFNESGEKVWPWSNFMKWLRAGNHVYWINGKAGSGKSTLMNYISTDPRTKEALMEWSGAGELLLPSFYFWKAGVELQKTITGLYRSLLYQVLKESPVVWPLFLESQAWAVHIPAWTPKRLLIALRAITCQTQVPISCCFFIDGLDEFQGASSGDYESLVAWIRSSAGTPGVKFCVSSRPERAFEIEFREKAMLKLQDLTINDISTYINDQVATLLSSRTKSADERKQVKELEKEILHKAEGIFLWVTLVIKSLRRGFQNEDSIVELSQRVKRIPSEMENLIRHLLDSLKDNEADRKEAAFYFGLSIASQISEECKSLNLLHCTLLHYKDRLDAMMNGEKLRITKAELIAASRIVQVRIATRSRGLLELSYPLSGEGLMDSSEEDSEESSMRSSEDDGKEDQEHYSIDDSEDGTPPDGSEDESRHDSLRGSKSAAEKLASIEIRFIHRTVYDFMVESETGKEVVGFGQEMFLNMAKTTLGTLSSCLREKYLHETAVISFEEYTNAMDCDLRLTFYQQFCALESRDRFERIIPFTKNVDVRAMGVGAQHCFTSYVQASLENWPKGLAKRSANYLLQCVLMQGDDLLGKQYRMLAYLELVEIFLRLEADPDKRFKRLDDTHFESSGITTFFSEFLSHLWYFTRSEMIANHLKSRWAEVCQTFISCGANLSTTFECRSKFYHRGITAYMAAIDYSLSLIFIIDQCFNDFNGRSRIETACTTPDFRARAVVSRIGLAAGYGLHFEPTESESRELVEALDVQYGGNWRKFKEACSELLDQKPVGTAIDEGDILW